MQSLNFRAATALPGHFGIELNLGRLDHEECAELTGWIEFYKTWRDRLHNGAVWLGEGADGLVWQAHGDLEAHEVLLFVTRLDPQTLRHSTPVRLPMLDRASAYRVEPLRSSASAIEASGAWLASHGLAVSPMQAEKCRIYHLRRGA
jgi:alpha-galactosidase